MEILFMNYLMEKLFQDKEGIPLDPQRLFYSEKQLEFEDECTLNDNDIPMQSTLILKSYN